MLDIPWEVKVEEGLLTSRTLCVYSGVENVEGDLPEFEGGSRLSFTLNRKQSGGPDFSCLSVRRKRVPSRVYLSVIQSRGSRRNLLQTDVCKSQR